MKIVNNIAREKVALNLLSYGDVFECGDTLYLLIDISTYDGQYTGADLFSGSVTHFDEDEEVILVTGYYTVEQKG